jgi:hypothetical protein
MPESLPKQSSDERNARHDEQYACVQLQNVYKRQKAESRKQKEEVVKEQTGESATTSLPACESDAYLIRGSGPFTNQRLGD